MTQILAWLDQHHINAMTVVDTVAILVLASIIILVFNRFIWRWLTYLQARLHVTDETNLIISRSVTTALWILAVFMVLNLWGVGPRRELIDPAIAAHSGRIVKLMGDGALVEFASAVEGERD